MKKPIKDLAASVHSKLLNKAKETGRTYNELAQNFFMERFLYRLSKSKHAKHFCLKGALMFVGWDAPMSRPTKDIDLLGQIDAAVGSLVKVFQEVCRQPVEPDGLSFDPKSVEGEEIADDAEYGGIRILISGKFHKNAQIKIQLDVGFGDKIVPAPTIVTLKPILDFPAPRLRGYSRESSIAEKFEAMVKRGLANSRMKDFYDIWYLSMHFEFDGKILAKAIQETFNARERKIQAEPAAFSDEFVRQKQIPWRTFVRRSRLKDVSDDFAEIISALRAFLQPVATAIESGKVFSASWPAKGPWKP